MDKTKTFRSKYSILLYMDYMEFYHTRVFFFRSLCCRTQFFLKLKKECWIVQTTFLKSVSFFNQPMNGILSVKIAVQFIIDN